MIEIMTFGEALELLKQGKQIKRLGWNRNDLFIELAIDGAYYSKPIPGSLVDGKESYHIEPFFVIHTPNRNINEYYRTNTWVPSISDCLAEDWMVV